jgi:hypothetical protein
MRVLFAAILTLLLAGCIDMGSEPVAEAPKPCKHATAEACTADAMCGWDAYGGADNTGKCKTKDKIKPADPHTAPAE